MKISLINATYYFNPPVNLTPISRTMTVDLDSLEDGIVRKLNLAVVTGVIEITEGSADFNERVKTILKIKKEDVKTPVVPVTPVEEVKVEVVEEPKVEKEPVKDEEPVAEKKTATAKKTTATKKTTTK